MCHTYVCLHAIYIKMIIFKLAVETKVLFADEHLLILFDCKINEAGCQPNGKEIVINQRDRESPLSAAAINFVKDVIRTQTCENPDILEILSVPGV